MFLRRCNRKKNGKPHSYWALVESYRTAQGSRQRVGACLSNAMARRGYSRDSRPDCLQVCIGLVVTEEGMPLGYEVFDGNTHDSKTVEQHLTEKDWHEVQEGVEVKWVHGPDGREVFVLARSRDRRQKEQAMHERFIGRLEAALQKMQQSAATGHLKDPSLAHRRLGRLQQRYWRAAGAFDVKIAPIEAPVGKARITISYSRNTRWSDWAAVSEGCYLLRTNLTGVDPATLWKRYIQLTEAEWAFRITKDELVIRPIWHQKSERVQAHILVCFLAYGLWKTLGQWMHRSGLGDAPRTLLLELARIKSGDVVLPVRSPLDKPADPPARLIRLRCVTTPDEAQKVLLNRLGLTLPQRLRRIDEVMQM